jgi:uncharacterized cofD-like protein
VTIGGGHGLATVLRGLKEYAAQDSAYDLDLTGIVTVADDGGSSGKLRREMGVLPPGDFRNCLIALADSESLMTRLFQYRFGDGTGLDGHSFGNLFITAMAEITGSFERALAESSRVLAVQGRVFPSTLRDVTLVAQIRDTHTGNIRRVTGESRIPEAGGTVQRLSLEPEDAPAFPDAVRALLGADLILAGPGSLYTSVLPNLLVADIRQAIRASRALKIYICNVATQKGETEHFAVADHVAALDRHLGPGLFQIVVANDDLTPGCNLPAGVEMVLPELNTSPGLGRKSMCLKTAELVDPVCPWRHDAARLSQTLLELYTAQRAT